MIAQYHGWLRDEPERSARPLSETIQRIRLIRLAHSDDPLAAAIATAVTLLLPRIDRLIEQRERAV